MEEQFDNSREEIKPEEGAEPIEGYQEPDKFKEKSREDIIKSYQELEKLRSKEAENIKSKGEEKAQEIADMENQGAPKEDVDKAKKDLKTIEKELEEELENVDFSKMNDPRKYSKFILQKARQMAETVAESKARDTYANETSYRTKLQNELKSVAKEYPILEQKTEESENFKQIVLDVMTAAKTRGESFSLKGAVERASKLTGKIGKQEQPKPRQVEKPQGQTPSQTKTENDEMKESLMRKNKSSLGGL